MPPLRCRPRLKDHRPMSELYHPRHLSPALWSIAGIVAIALHAGGVGLAFMSKQPDSEPDLGAPAIEIGIELTEA